MTCPGAGAPGRSLARIAPGEPSYTQYARAPPVVCSNSPATRWMWWRRHCDRSPVAWSQPWRPECQRQARSSRFPSMERARADSNGRPLAPEASALSTELRALARRRLRTPSPDGAYSTASALVVVRPGVARQGARTSARRRSARQLGIARQLAIARQLGIVRRHAGRAPPGRQRDPATEVACGRRSPPQIRHRSGVRSAFYGRGGGVHRPRGAHRSALEARRHRRRGRHGTIESCAQDRRGRRLRGRRFDDLRGPRRRRRPRAARVSRAPSSPRRPVSRRRSPGAI
jgi:hypothetical protein